MDTAKTEPKATHEVKVLRADGTEEVVSRRTLSPEEAKNLLEVMRAEAPAMVEEAERSATEAKKEKYLSREHGAHAEAYIDDEDYPAEEEK